MKKFIAYLLCAIFFESSAVAGPWGMLQVSNQVNPVAGSSVGTLALDGTNANFIGGNCPCTVAATTALTNDIIVVAVAMNSSTTSTPSISSVSDAAGLTWAKVAGPNNFNNGGQFGDVEFWWAESTGTLSSDTITVNSAATTNNSLISVFGFHGANLTTPFDPNGALPAQTNGSSVTTLTNNVSTTKASTAIITDLYVGASSWGTLTGLSGFTPIQSIGNVNEIDYKIVSSTQSAVPETYSWTTARSAGYTLIAIQASGQ